MNKIDKDLAVLARHEWPGGKHSASITSDGMSAEFYDHPLAGKYTYPQYLHARHVLGLDDHVMTEEEEAMPAKEHRNKYMREIKPGVWVDVYDVLHAWAVKNPALQHLIKKALQPGERGHKTIEQDMNDIVASATRARELEK